MRSFVWAVCGWSHCALNVAVCNITVLTKALVFFSELFGTLSQREFISDSHADKVISVAETIMIFVN